MKKILLLVAVFFGIQNLTAQILNEQANWPDDNWTLTGTYDAAALLADPTVDDVNFSYDDDAAGSGSTDVLELASPVVDLTAANAGGDIQVEVSFDYNYNFGAVFDLEYYDADAAAWTNWDAIADNSSTTAAWCENVAGAFTSEKLDFSGFSANQLANFQYRLFYDASSVFGWGFCVNPPTIVSIEPSSTPPACTTLSSPANGATDVAVDANISWNAEATGTATGYRITAGTSSGGTDIANNENVGAMTTYDPPVDFAFDDVVYVTITPYNLAGDAISCTEESFTVLSNPASEETVTCGAVTNDTHCYDNNEDNTWLYTASDGTSALKMTFVAGQFESCCDDIIVYDGIDATAPILYQGNNSGDLAGLEVTATGANIFLTIDSDGSVSCVSSGYTLMDWNVECLSCTPAGGTASIGMCDPTNGIMINVDVTSIGDGTVIIQNDGGVGDVTVMTTGVTSIGPFAFSSVVTVTLAHPTDAVCDVVLPAVTLSAGCPPAEDVCTGAIDIPVVTGSCAGLTVGNNTNATDSNNDPNTPVATCSSYDGGDIWFKLTVPASGDLTISGGPSPDCCSFLWYEVYEGACGSLTSFMCSSTSGNDPSAFEMELTGRTPGEVLYVRAWDSSNDNGPGDFNFCAFEPVCLSPEAGNPLISFADCPTSTTIIFDVTSMGDATSLTVTNDAGGTNPAPITATGTGFEVTDLPTSGTVTITLEHNVDPSCNIDLGPYTLSCPPENDDVANATALTVDDPCTGDAYTNLYSSSETGEPEGACFAVTTTVNSVWFTFVAPATGAVRVNNDIAGDGTGDLTDGQLAVYSVGSPTDFATFTEVACSEDNGTVVGSGFMNDINVDGLNPGETYYILMDGYASATGDFCLEVTERSANDECTTSTDLAMDTGGTLPSESFAAATASGLGAAPCDGDATATPLDVWYKVNTDADGGMLEITVEAGVGSDIAIQIFLGCPTTSGENVACADGALAGGTETLSIVANFKDNKGTESRDADYFVRVYEKTPSGSTFSIAAAGSALPIELVDFRGEATKAGNKITWSTASEINNEYQMIEKSIDGKSEWKEVGRVESTGDTKSLQTYELMDDEPYQTTYYRINSMDLDGRGQLSGVISVERERVGKSIKLFPNPARLNAALEINTDTEESAQISIYDMTGKLVYATNTNLELGYNEVKFDMSNYQNGLYTVTVQSETISKTMRLVKN